MTSNDLEPDDLKLLLHAQDLPIESRPYERIAMETGLTEDEVVRRLAALMDRGFVRRMAARIPHRKVGFHGNIMCVLDVPADKVDEVGAAVAASPHVSHCYSRTGWIYNLFFMVHGTDREDGMAMARSVLDGIGMDLKHDFLYSTTEFKKQSFMLKDWQSILIP